MRLALGAIGRLDGWFDVEIRKADCRIVVDGRTGVTREEAEALIDCLQPYWDEEDRLAEQRHERRLDDWLTAALAGDVKAREDLSRLAGNGDKGARRRLGEHALDAAYTKTGRKRPR